MAGGIAALLLKAEDNNRWAVILHQADGRETILPSTTPAEHLIAASEVDYSAYRREIRNLREHHPLFEERLEVSQVDFEDFVAEALLLPAMLREIDPMGYFVVVQLMDQSLRQEDDGSALFLLNAAAQLLQILEEPLRAQVYLRNALEIACDGMERATQQERYQKLIGTYPELQRLCDPALLPDDPDQGKVYAAYSMFGLLGAVITAGSISFPRRKKRPTTATGRRTGFPASRGVPALSATWTRSRTRRCWSAKNCGTACTPACCATPQLFPKTGRT